MLKPSLSPSSLGNIDAFITITIFIINCLCLYNSLIYITINQIFVNQNFNHTNYTLTHSHTSRTHTSTHINFLNLPLYNLHTRIYAAIFKNFQSYQLRLCFSIIIDVLLVFHINLICLFSLLLLLLFLFFFNKFFSFIFYIVIIHAIHLLSSVYSYFASLYFSSFFFSLCIFSLFFFTFFSLNSMHVRSDVAFFFFIT